MEKLIQESPDFKPDDSSKCGPLKGKAGGSWGLFGGVHLSTAGGLACSRCWKQAMPVKPLKIWT